MYFSLPKSSSKQITLLLLAVLTLTGSVFAQRDNSKAGDFARGQAAIDQLSERLPAVARRYGKSANKLRRLLLEDATLHVDETDRLLYIDEAPEQTEEFADDAPLVSKAAPYSYSQTFALHSRPGSSRVIYLDFDGHVTSNTAWNSGFTGGAPINSAAFSIDGDPTTFTAQEQDVIQYVWQRVAEDYAAFDVDVTTQEPGDDAIFRSSSSDTQYGTRVVISPTNFMSQSIGGVAYVGVFNYTGNYYKPAFVMSANLSNNSRNIAEATSHEVGHNLGLDHDGTSSAGYYSGHGDWAPIMGVGYYKSVTQWSKGEYSGANNQQDDLAVMQNYGIPVLSDDHGNSSGSATALSGTSISASGLITTRTDVDVFRFSTGTGNVSINLSPAALGGNLDIEAKITDSAGNVIAVSNPSGLAASFNQYLASGTYYLSVDGAGFGDPATGYSDYASIGQYSVAGTLVAGSTTQQPPIASVSANVTSGTTPLTVAFSSVNSSDSDGSIVGYNWSFGDGTANSSEPNPVHVYYSAGTFTATLTVTDNSGLTNSKSVQITASQPANQLPVARAAASTTSGYAPLTVNFTGGNSYDPDGSISSYSWNFGDGGVSNQANPSYVYNNAGTFTATLTVTDNSGARSSSSVVINVLQQPAPSSVIYIGNISMSLVQSNRAAQAVVTVYDNNGVRVSGVTVTGNWSGVVKGSVSGTTNSNGQAVFTSPATKRRGTFTINISNLSAAGYTYNPNLNARTTASISN